jgi:hypothetical protein
VLEDGTSIGEVPAIFRYLEEICPNPKLLGATAKKKALGPCGSGGPNWKASPP